MNELNNIGNIIEFLEKINKKYGNKTALQIKDTKGYRSLSYLELGNRTIDVSSTLIKLGIQKGDRVAIISENRPEWGIAFFGIISAGAIVVPLDVRLKEKELSYILDDCGAEYVFASQQFIQVIKNLHANIKKIISLDEDILSIGKLKYTEGEQKTRQVELEDTAVIVYTSGTTGNPKGVELTYRNLFFQIFSFNKLLKYGREDNFLSLLPLNHTFELTCGFLGPLYGGACITYLQTFKPTEISSTMKETKTTIMIVVPLILQMFYNSIMKEIDRSSAYMKKLFRLSLKVSRICSALRKILFKKVHNRFGGSLRCFISGGAPLDTKIAFDFQLMGIPVLQGYGLTETSPVISANTLSKNRLGSVGRLLEGVKVKICEHGEIATQGPHVMKGYFRDSIRTLEVIKDGWFHTGDIGEIDKDGFLYIKGRIKNLIVTAGGKKIHPEEVEEELLKSPYIKEICVVGKKGRKGAEEVYAVIVPDDEVLKGNKDEIRKIIDLEIKKYSHNLADYKRIVNFEIWQEELPKTSSRKIRRKEVLERIKE